MNPGLPHGLLVANLGQNQLQVLCVVEKPELEKRIIIDRIALPYHTSKFVYCTRFNNTGLPKGTLKVNVILNLHELKLNVQESQKE